MVTSSEVLSVDCSRSLRQLVLADLAQGMAKGDVAGWLGNGAPAEVLDLLSKITLGELTDLADMPDLQIQVQISLPSLRFCRDQLQQQHLYQREVEQFVTDGVNWMVMHKLFRWSRDAYRQARQHYGVRPQAGRRSQATQEQIDEILRLAKCSPDTPRRSLILSVRDRFPNLQLQQIFDVLNDSKLI
ncbi:STY4526/YPO1902 family pathogenicity island replication protein [Parachitinimonas caeni]|uniref:STY4526/YPO1902 family pathogenicity island replication protein n=1 Tax=Parachitinimonas caeni TaxID=3031301 RepID=A0ABT7E2D9_9NEIS|nr:STY4526/YPO1902 family pathogenicity island replication protein [Parachitinimonas caeni]MDK2126481.1 STY4526/YPO1902 family pathogenicity island replication protein [Parachitinimonas caeni]